MKLPPYPKYKPSSVAWLGDVPEQWEVKKLGYGARLQGGYAFASDKFESEGVPVVRMNNLKRGVLDTSEASCIAPENCLDDFTLAEGDLLWGMSGSVGETGSLGNFARVRACDMPAQLNQRVGRFYVIGDSYSLDFLTYAIQTKLFYDQILLRVTGTAQFNVSSEQVQSSKVPFPPVPEQAAIASFLDRETSRIDRLVGKKRKLIERLKEKRTALISRTVTRGLPPAAARADGLPEDTALKPSGLDWLGDIPKHWEVLTVRRRAKRIQTGGTPPTAEERYYEDGTVPWFGPGSFDDQIVVSQPVKLLNASAVKDGAARMFAAGATMVVTIGATLGKVSSLTEAGSCNQQITVIEFDLRRVHPRFATYQLKRLEPAMRAIAPSATLPILDQGEIADIALGLPPLPEQAAIAAYLDAEIAKLDMLVAKVEAAVERLQEYRTVLITAAVTGKIDVRKVPEPR